MGIRKAREIAWWIYKLFYLPIAKFIIECKTDSIIKQRVFYDSGLVLKGKNFIGQNTYASNIEMGYAAYVSRDCYLINTKIGSYTSIGNYVKIVSGKHPIHDFVSTHPSTYASKTLMGLSYVKDNIFLEHEYVDGDGKWSVSIGNDVWIGDNVTIMEGVCIGDGAIIGCSSLVTKDVKAYSINYGIPCECRRNRFEEEEIRKLLELKWWNREESWIKEHINKFTNIREFLKEEV
ncbi:MAG: CatB-related O-acetyltransferase [Eubacteriales bacterium]